MVYQQPNWIRSLTVLENVAFPLILLGIDKTESTKRAWEAIFNVGMREWTNYKPTELSGGQQQKVALARALVIDPEIIVADEPTGNLDYESGKNLMEMLVNLNKQGRTIIMVTHDLEYLKYCNTAVRIKDGVIQGVYRGSEVLMSLKDSGLGLKRAEEPKAAEQTTKVEEVKPQPVDENAIKAKQVLERANKRIEEMNKEKEQEQPKEVKKEEKKIINNFKGIFKSKEDNTNIKELKIENNTPKIQPIQKVEKPKKRKFKKSKKK